MGRYIALALPALLALLLFAPVYLEAVWRREVLHLRLRLFWLLPVTILPEKEEPEKEKKPRRAKKKPPREKPRRERDPAEAALDLLGLINDLLPRVGEFFGRVTRGVAVTRCRIALIVTGEEADQAGIACGRAYALGYGAYSVLSGVVRVREFRYHVMPDFLAERGAADAEVTLRARPVTLLAAGCILLFHLIKTFALDGRSGAKSEARR